MKFFEVNVNSNIKLKDDSEVTMHPTEGIPCVLKDGKYYSPSLVWLEFHPAGTAEERKELFSTDSEELDLDDDEGFWLELDDEEEADILEDIYDEQIEFRPLSDDEVKDLEDSDDEY